MPKGILLEFESIAHAPDRDLIPLLREIQNLGHQLYRREFLAACDYVMYVDSARRHIDTAEHFLEAVFHHLWQKPKKTEIMSLAPVFEEAHRYALYDDVVRALPAIAKGNRVAVLSPLPAFMMAGALEPIKPHILAVVTPREARAVPPNPAAYHAALLAIKLRAKDVALVSSQCLDLAIGNPLGLRPVFLRRHDDVPCPEAAATISTFEELETALRPPPKQTPAASAPPAPPDSPATPTPGR